MSARIDSRSMTITPKMREAEGIKRRLARAARQEELLHSRAQCVKKQKSSTPGRVKSKKRAKLVPIVAKPFQEPPKYKKGMGAEFYSTREWRELRWKLLIESDGCCVYCGRSKKDHGIAIHIDHIKPRSKFPSLELSKDNLQVTCADCNIGKGATIL